MDLGTGTLPNLGGDDPVVDTCGMKAEVHIIDLRGTDIPERLVLDKDAKLEAQPCGSTEWVALENKGELELHWKNLDTCNTEGCQDEALAVIKKERKQVALRSGKVINVRVHSFDTHLLRITGKYEVAKAHPWCIPCQANHPEGKHKNPQTVEPTTT